MKKIIEVLLDGKGEVRFDTDIDISKHPDSVRDVVIKAAVAMQTTLWGGNKLSPLAMIRALSIANLAVSVNLEEMAGRLEDVAKCIRKSLNEARREMAKSGAKIQLFGSGMLPSEKRS